MAPVDQSLVVAIDGPGGSGKSTVAREVARRLGWAHLDTGAMYRAVAWAVLRAGIDPADGQAVAALAHRLEIEVGERVLVDGADATAGIRSAEVTNAVSVVSAHPEVRTDLVRRQRQWVAAHGGAVVEGRDIGSVVFPHARLKAYLTASEEERARRRAQQLAHAPAGVAADLARRDRLDSTRATSPLTVAPGAVVVDTTDKSVDEVVEAILERL
ncbi:MAG TPA: (d)CMP kinase [Acidimicrobiales bacterium]|nr:(d)CMP kinase [Acidimicrobiales bacterium]